MKRLFALRGAIKCENNEDDIILRVQELYDELLEQNSLAVSDIVSLVFSVTSDINALNPATALRRTGRGGDLALFVLQEGVFAQSASGIIRALLHCYLEEGASPQHAYLNGAEILRPDRAPG